jgi:peptidoglycan hydrolase-like protein with peptidoglycan-binding domain
VESLADAPKGVQVAGYLSPDAGFVAPGARPAAARPAPAPAPAPAPVAEPVVDPAEAAEAALGLDQAARRKVQERLTVLGYGTRGIDGLFGPGTRGAIAKWQADQALAATGYLSAEQTQRLATQADDRSAELAAAAETRRQQEQAADAAFWRTTGANGATADMRAYLARYPDGIYAEEARAALQKDADAARAAAAGEDRAAWDRAVQRGDVEGYRGYLESYPQGAFAAEAAARVAELRDQSDKTKANKAAAAAEDGLGLNQASRALIEGQLKALGFPVGATDGQFNRDTRRALRQFQTRQGLEVTGYVNQQTIQGLIVASLGLR